MLSLKQLRRRKNQNLYVLFTKLPPYGRNMPPEEWRPFQNQGQIWNKHNSELKFSCVRQASKGCVYPFSTTIQYFQIKYTLFSQRNTKFHDFWIWIFLFIYKLALPATFDLCRRKKIAMTWKKNIYSQFFHYILLKLLRITSKIHLRK